MNEILESSEWTGDVLRRKKYSLFLTKYLEDKNDPFVININSPWGTGKTFFLTNWYEDVKKIHPAIYFNAWANDYGSDPLLSIISSINKGLITSANRRSKTGKTFIAKSAKMVKQFAPVIIKGIAKKAIGSDCVEEIIDINDDDQDTIADLTSEFSKKLIEFEKTSNIIEEFKTSVTELIDEVIAKNSDLSGPLFVFIDELDRCRPLYSIELLEKIKHIFDIPRVVFIIASDTLQLSHSIKAVYGSGFDGETYLRRFFDQIYTLPEPNCAEFVTLLFEGFETQANYFNYYVQNPTVHANENFGLEVLKCKQSLHDQKILILTLFSTYFRLDLRTIKQCFERFVSIEKTIKQNEEIHFAYLIFLIMLNAKYPKEFKGFFINASLQTRKSVLEGLDGDLRHKLKVYNHEINAETFITKYLHNTLKAKTQLRASFQNREVDDIDSRLLTSLLNNYDFIELYKDRVEMAGALE